MQRRFSDITVFSFHPVKIITSAEGGIATTNNLTLRRRMADFRSHGITKEEARFECPSPGPWSYEQQDSFNYRLTDLQAALGFLNQLQRLEAIVIERQQLFEVYQNLLSSLPLSFSVSLPTSALRYILLLLFERQVSSASSCVFEGLRARGIGQGSL